MRLAISPRILNTRMIELLQGIQKSDKNQVAWVTRLRGALDSSICGGTHMFLSFRRDLTICAKHSVSWPLLNGKTSFDVDQAFLMPLLSLVDKVGVPLYTATGTRDPHLLLHLLESIDRAWSKAYLTGSGHGQLFGASPPSSILSFPSALYSGPLAGTSLLPLTLPPLNPEPAYR